MPPNTVMLDAALIIDDAFADKDGEDPVWWFGGGFDLTPYYGFVEDCVHWHQTAHDAVTPFGESLHSKFKTWCDDYFYLKHRQEARGIGGLFFDDFSGNGFEHAFAMRVCACAP